MDRGCPLDLLDSVRPQRASGTRPYGAPALGGIGVVVCGFAVRPLMFQGNGNTRGGECNPPTGDLIPAGPQAARLCRVVASPHISPIVAKTRIGDWSPAGRTGNRADAWDAGRTRHPWGSRLLRAGWNGARERMRRRTGATPAASRRSADRAGSSCVKNVLQNFFGICGWGCFRIVLTEVHPPQSLSRCWIATH